VRRGAGAVKGPGALGDDAFEAHLTRVAKDDIAGVLQVLVELQASAARSQHTDERRLAHLDGLTPQVLAVELEQIEAPHEHVPVLQTPAQLLEDRQTGSVTRHRLAVDDARSHRQRRQGLADQRIARGEIGAVPGQETKCRQRLDRPTTGTRRA
jgi:hypothetical protein